MQSLKSDFEVFFWDFDGVIMDSMKVRDEGFEIVLKDYPRPQVQKLMEFHKNNGGLSRYVKFRYFFEEIRNENVSEEKVKVFANKFSEVMMERLMDKTLLIQDSLDFIENNHQNYVFHIVSGSDGQELNLICEELGINKYFLTINGSPTPKIELVERLIQKFGYDITRIVLIGDSHNDYEAAIRNNISFYGYNNENLKELSSNYIESFQNL